MLPNLSAFGLQDDRTPASRDSNASVLEITPEATEPLVERPTRGIQKLSQRTTRMDFARRELIDK